MVSMRNEQQRVHVATHSDGGPAPGIVDTCFGIPPLERVRAFITREFLCAVGHGIGSVLR